MPQPSKIPLAFASSGDKNVIPESTETTGLASWRDGFPAITSTPFSEGGIAPKRADFNGIFNALSLAIIWQQQGGFYAYSNAVDYEVGNVVIYNNDLYKCVFANGPSTSVKSPTDTTAWSKVMTAADAAALYLPLSGGTMTGAIISNSTAALLRPNNTSQLTIEGGMNTASTSGAKLILAGSERSQTPGIFNLQAGNSSGYKQLIGKPDGTLEWDGADLLTSRFWGDNTSDMTVSSNANVTAGNDANTNLASVTLTKGTYLLFLTATFSENAIGYRQIHLSTSPTGGPLDRFRAVRLPPCPTGTTKITLFVFLQVTASSATYYFNARQTSGGNLTVSEIGYMYQKVRA